MSPEACYRYDAAQDTVSYSHHGKWLHLLGVYFPLGIIQLRQVIEGAIECYSRRVLIGRPVLNTTR